MWEWNHDLSQQLIASRETVRCSANDLSTMKRELAKLKEHHKKFKKDYHNPIESLKKAHNLAIT